jgi:ankyrin repeat protein
MQEYQEGKHEPSVLTMQTIESLSLDEKQMWRSIRKELEDIGISVAAFDANKDFILDWFKTALNTGAFEEETLEENPSSILGEDDFDQSSEDLRSTTACQSISQDLVQPQRERAAIAEPSEEETQAASNSKQQVSRPDGPRDSSKDIEIRALNPIRDPRERKRPPRIAALVAWLLRYNKSLLVASMEGDEATVRKLLLVKGIDSEFRDGVEKRTPLHLAAAKGHEAIARLLLEKEADVESKDTYNRTPLSLAARDGHESVVKLLLEKEADVESKDKYNQTPLSWAARDGHESVVKLLLEKDADVESKDKYNQTPLLLAAGNGHESVVKLLLEKEADVESKDTYNQTPLSWAARDGHESVVKLLLEKDADVESKDKYNQTPLLLAARYGHESVVKLLLEKEADVESKDTYNQTPFSLAARNGHEAAVKQLLEKEAG